MTLCENGLRIAVLLLAVNLGLYANPCETPAKDSSRIVVAGGSLTEIMYFLGLNDRIVGVDSTSNFPEEASNHPIVGYVRALSTEGLLSLRPTLILGENDMGPPEVLQQLESIEVETVVVEETHTAQGIIDKINCVASTLDAVGEFSAELQDGLISSREALHKFQQKDYKPKVGFILSLTEGSLLASGTGTSAAGFLEMIGATNAFDQFEGWKSVSKESLVQVNPQFLIFTQRAIGAMVDETAVQEHAAIRMTKAAETGGIVIRDGMEMLGFGPRTLKAAVDVAELIHEHHTGE